MTGLLASWLGISRDTWAQIIGGAALAVISALVYQSGRLRPLAVRAKAKTLKHTNGGLMTEVRIDVKSRTRDTQTISRVALAEWPALRHRVRHPRWRTSEEGFPVTQFDWTSLPADGLEVPGKDAKKIRGTIAVYPPYPSTRALVKSGVRKRPVLKRIKQLS
jgi:hypothetical protein